MTLSSGTLNLKFMQRAAARQQAQTSSNPSTPQATSTPIKPTSRANESPAVESKQSVFPSTSLVNAEAGPSTPLARFDFPEQPSTPLTPTEKEARWSLPRRKRENGVHGGSNLAFESGYMSFLMPVEDEVRGEGTGGGGRMAFGGFGVKEDEDVTQADKEGEEGDNSIVEEDKRRKRPRPTETAPETPGHGTRTFMRPQGFEDRMENSSANGTTTSRPTDVKKEAVKEEPPSTHGSKPDTKRRKFENGSQAGQPSRADRLRAIASGDSNVSASSPSTSTPRASLKSASHTPELPHGESSSVHVQTHEVRSDGSKRKKRRKDRGSLSGPGSQASGTASPIKQEAPASSLLTLDEKQAQQRAEKNRRKKEKRKAKKGAKAGESVGQARDEDSE